MSAIGFESRRAGNFKIWVHWVSPARLLTPMSFRASPIASTAPAMSDGVIAPMQPTRKPGVGVL